MILQVSDQFLDELLNDDVGNEGRVSDIIMGREHIQNDENLQMHSTSILDFIVKDEPPYEDDVLISQKDRIKKHNHNLSISHIRFFKLWPMNITSTKFVHSCVRFRKYFKSIEKFEKS